MDLTNSLSDACRSLWLWSWAHCYIDWLLAEELSFLGLLFKQLAANGHLRKESSTYGVVGYFIRGRILLFFKSSMITSNVSLLPVVEAAGTRRKNWDMDAKDCGVPFKVTTYCTCC